MPRHHVPPDALLAFAAGAGRWGEDLLVSCHLTLCPACRRAVEAAEAVGGALLDRIAPAPTPGSPPSATPMPVPPPSPACPVFPAPLRAVVGPLDRAPWRPVGLGVRIAHLDRRIGERVFLLDLPAGLRLPVHGHRGIERTLVLRGGFTDERDTFDPGDVSWHAGPRHDVHVHRDGPCTALFVNDGPADFGVLTGVVDRWLGMGRR